MPSKVATQCASAPCTRLARRRGRCDEHRDELFADQPPCLRLDCERRSMPRGLCTTHIRHANRMHLSVQRYIEVVNAPCGICGAAGPSQIDHDHDCCPANESCGRCVRGPLCWPCNVAAAWATGEHWERVTRARSWIERFAQM